MTPSTTISPGLSDLFFNHRLDHYDALYARAAATKDWPDKTVIREAVLKDATEFCSLLAAAYHITEDPVALTEDLMARI